MLYNKQEADGSLNYLTKKEALVIKKRKAIVFYLVIAINFFL